MRTIELTRDEAEMLVGLIDKERDQMGDHIDVRLAFLSEVIREEFGMVTYEEEMKRVNERLGKKE